MNLTGYLGVGLAVALLGLWLAVSHGQSIQREYDLFKGTQAALAKAQLAENAKLKAQLEGQKKTLEAENEKNLASVRGRYDAELHRLRAQRTGPRGVPGASPAPKVCAGEADNDRLSNALSRYRERILGLLEQAERQTVTLLTCQAWISR